MGVFDVAKAKVQGATGQVGNANSALGNAEGGRIRGYWFRGRQGLK